MTFASSDSVLTFWWFRGGKTEDTPSTEDFLLRQGGEMFSANGNEDGWRR